MKNFLGKWIMATLLLINSVAVFAEDIASDYFNGIHISGNFIVHLYPARHATVNFENIDSSCVDFSVIDNTLTIALPKNVQKQMDSPVTVSIGMPYVNYIAVAGDTTVTGRNMRGEAMTVMTAGNSRVILDGHFNLRRIDAEDNSEVNLRWVSGGNIAVTGDDTAIITLAGVTNLLQTVLKNQACLHAKYLRAKVILIHTVDQTIATILPLHALYAFAEGHSNIYYYTDPNYVLTNTHISGNVLQLGHWQ